MRGSAGAIVAGLPGRARRAPTGSFCICRKQHRETRRRARANVAYPAETCLQIHWPTFPGASGTSLTRCASCWTETLIQPPVRRRQPRSRPRPSRASGGIFRSVSHGVRDRAPDCCGVRGSSRRPCGCHRVSPRDVCSVPPGQGRLRGCSYLLLRSGPQCLPPRAPPAQHEPAPRRHVRGTHHAPCSDTARCLHPDQLHREQDRCVRARGDCSRLLVPQGTRAGEVCLS